MEFTELLHKALVTVNRLHQGQVLKGIQHPYIVHPVAVAMIR